MSANQKRVTQITPPSFHRPELLAPAGNWDCAKAAVENGADAIYFGLERFNARMRADNFTEADLPELMAFLHRRGVKGYVTFNTLVFPQELVEAQQYLRTIIAAGVDAMIVQDVGICRLIRHLSPDFPIHASTQMTITSAMGVEFARSLGCHLVVLARECSIKEIDKIQSQLATRDASLPLEVFVHGALCVAYSGQCLTSEALGGRSANRGECAQACRMPYDLIADGEVVDLDNRKYLLSPQDLAGLEVIPELVKVGVTSLKIEGRLKTPEYVANVTRVYRQALDRVMDALNSIPPSPPYKGGNNLAPLVKEGNNLAPLVKEGNNLAPVVKEGNNLAPVVKEENNLAPVVKEENNLAPLVKGENNVTPPVKEGNNLAPPVKGENNLAPLVKGGWGDRSSNPYQVTDTERYNLEMAFSRGVYSGWLRGINNQELVHARFGKKRGVYLGEVTRIQDGRDKRVTVRLQAPVKAGDGVVFDCDRPQTQEEGGRVYAVEQRGKEAVLTFGQRDINLRRVHVGDKVWKTSDPELDRQLRQTFSGDKPQFQRPIHLEVYGEVGQLLTVIARDELGHLVKVESSMPLVEAQAQPLTTDRLREQLGRLGNTPFCLRAIANHLSGEVMLPVSELNRLRREVVTQLEELRSQPKRWQLHSNASLQDLLPSPTPPLPQSPILIVLVRNLKQLQAALQAGVQTLYCEFEDPRAYRDAVRLVRDRQTIDNQTIWVAPPRITKSGENYILQQVRSSQADGYLVRNYDHLQFFAAERCIGDFSLNVANALTADYLKHRFNLERLTASYDLNITQLEALLTSCPPHWFEVTIHQHMPMFHMEHCVFCAFLSAGTDYTNCGRPCEKHEVKLRDRVGIEHVLQADAGCRNTVFNGKAQTGAEYVQRLLEFGVRYFRIEFVNETPNQVTQTIDRYRQLLQGEITGSQLWRELKLQNQLGVTRGPLEQSKI